MKTWTEMCKSPTRNKPPDLRHKTFSLCRHKMKDHIFCLFETRPGSPKIWNFARIYFEPHREFTKEQGKISLCLTSANQVLIIPIILFFSLDYSDYSFEKWGCIIPDYSFCYFFLDIFRLDYSDYSFLCRLFRLLRLLQLLRIILLNSDYSDYSQYLQ